jgi:glutathione S-transferase
MILIYTPNSPYARTARIALREWGLLAITEERLADNREAHNPVLEFSPVGRVPTLVHNGMVITEACNVFAYIKHLASAADTNFIAKADWTTVVQEGQISGFLEGIAFWVREKRRAPQEQSDFLLSVERDRTLRCLNYFDTLSTNGSLPTISEFRAAALACALHLMDMHHFIPNWRMEYSTLAKWFQKQTDRPSMQETLVFN